MIHFFQNGELARAHKIDQRPTAEPQDAGSINGEKAGYNIMIIRRRYVGWEQVGGSRSENGEMQNIIFYLKICILLSRKPLIMLLGEVTQRCKHYEVKRKPIRGRVGMRMCIPSY